MYKATGAGGQPRTAGEGLAGYRPRRINGDLSRRR
jgi:hypothetical protein